MPELDAETRALIDVHLPSYGTSQNPVDVTAQAVHQFGYAEFARLVAGSPGGRRRHRGRDRTLPAPAHARPRAAREARARERQADLDVELHPAGASVQCSSCSEAGYPLFTDVHNCARAMRVMADYRAERDGRCAGEQQRKESQMGPFKDIARRDIGLRRLIEIRRPPNNFFDIALIQEIADALEALDQDDDCRAVVLAVAGQGVLRRRQFRRRQRAQPRGTTARRAGAAGPDTFISRRSACSAPGSRSSARSTARRSAAASGSRWWRTSA